MNSLIIPRLLAAVSNSGGLATWLVPDAIKETWVRASEEDTITDPAFDGISCRVLRNC